MKHAIAALLLALTAAGSAWACSCMPPAPGEDNAAYVKRMIKESAAAFTGRVLSATRTDPDINRGELIARVRILRAYKGVRKGRIITLITGPNGALCGLDLEKGDIVSVAASRSNGTFHAGICSRI
jgi:hypothetical protein